VTTGVRAVRHRIWMIFVRRVRKALFENGGPQIFGPADRLRVGAARTCKTRCSMSCQAESPLELMRSSAIAAWSSQGHMTSAISDLVGKRQYPWRVATS